MMNENDKGRKDYPRESDLFKANTPEDTELAFQLQNADHVDMNLIHRVISRYGYALFTWIKILFTYYRGEPPNVDEILNFMQHVLVKAFRQIDRFHGQTSVVNWLFELSYSIARQEKRHITQISNNKPPNDSSFSLNSREEFIHFQQRLGNLSDVEYFTLLLHYFFDFELEDIAYIFHVSLQKTYQRFSKGRTILNNPGEKSHQQKQLNEYLGGVLEPDSKAFAQLEQHIAGCIECQSAVLSYKEEEENLSDYIKRLWKATAFDFGKFDILIQAIHDQVDRRPEVNGINIEVRKSAWFLGFTLLFVILAVVFINMTPVEREFPKPTPTNAPQLPPLSQGQPFYELDQFDQNSAVVPRYVEPDFSSDGSWGVFSSITADPFTGLLMLPTVEIYDRSKNELTVIHESVGSLSATWSGWDLAPSISSDGRWIVYAGTVYNSNEDSVPCETLQKNTCADIFLYDRETDSTNQITHGWNGEAANGVNLSPAISSNGEWIAFWSTANNLIEGDDVQCEIDVGAAFCVYVYLYNQYTGNIDRIPVGTTVSGTDITLGRISVTSDGRYIGYTISVLNDPSYPATNDGVTFNLLGNAITRIEESYSIDYSVITTEAIVYNRDTGQAELLNLTEDGSIGDGPSSSPVLSNDGRFTAFVSGSTNLVEGDANDSTDIFVRDRKYGTIEVVSINSIDEFGNNDSGFTRWQKGYNSLDISGDGRYVVFESTATNLGQRIDNYCYFYQTTNCILLYIHDRKMNQTEFINALPNGIFLRYPKISDDGRWISYMQSKNNCNALPDYCSNVMLYDQSNRWVRNLTDYGARIQNLPWKPADSLTLPWEAWESKTISFASEGDLLAVGGTTGKIWVWKVDKVSGVIIDSKPVHVLDMDKIDLFTVITFSPNGQWLLAGTMSGTVFIWKLPGGELIYTINHQQGFIKDLVFTNDCSELIILASGKTSIWQIQDGQMVSDARFDTGSSAEISPKGNLIAYDHGDGETWIQRIPNGDIVGRLSNDQGQLRDVRDMVFSEDGSMLAVRFEDGWVIVWRLIETNPGSYLINLQTRFKTANVIGSLIFSPDNLYLIITGTFGDVVTWSVLSGEMYIITSTFHNHRIDSIAFTPSSDKLAVLVENEISLWKSSSDVSIRFFSQAPEALYREGIPYPLSRGSDIPEIIESSQLVIDKYEKVSEATQGITFPLLVPTRLPEFISFSDASLYSNGSICLKFDFTQELKDYSSLFICEWYIGNADPPVFRVGPETDIIPIDLVTMSGPKKAEFVIGDWYLGNNHTQNNPSTSGIPDDAWIWDRYSPSQRLRWVQYGILVSVYYQVDDPFTAVSEGSNIRITRNSNNPYINQTDLTQIAAGMRKFDEVSSYYLFNEGG